MIKVIGTEKPELMVPRGRLELPTQRFSGILSSLFSLLTIWPSYAVTAERLHDREFSGWWQVVLPLGGIVISGIGIALGILGIAILGTALLTCLLLWLIVQVFLLKGTDGPNRFGSDPLEPMPPTHGSDNKMGDGMRKVDYERVGAGE